MESLKEIIGKLNGDPYEILNCDPLAQFSIIKKNYRTLALKYHPDRNKDEEATNIFIKINQAYQFLESESNRKVYADHIKAIQQQKKRISQMSSERKKFAEDLIRKEQEYRQRKSDMESQIKKRKQFFEKKMRQEQEREEIRREIHKQMNPQQFYQQVSSIVVKWEAGLSFTSNMLKKAFSGLGYHITKINVESKRRRATIVINSIEKATECVKKFDHPCMEVEFLIQNDKRQRLLKALQRQKNQVIDLSLSSQNIERLKQVLNRQSHFYTDKYTNIYD